MRTFLVVTIGACLCGLLGACTMNNNPKANSPAVTGVLIDQACGAGMMSKDDPEKAAESHPKACAAKDACAASGYAVISGKEMIKFDDKGNQLAKDYLAKTDKTDNLKVTVEGTRTGDTIAVTSLMAAQ